MKAKGPALLPEITKNLQRYIISGQVFLSVGTVCAFCKDMLTYAYQARDASGKTISGLQEALNEDNAVNTLMSRGLTERRVRRNSITVSSIPSPCGC